MYELPASMKSPALQFTMPWHTFTPFLLAVISHFQRQQCACTLHVGVKCALVAQCFGHAEQEAFAERIKAN